LFETFHLLIYCGASFVWNVASFDLLRSIFVWNVSSFDLLRSIFVWNVAGQIRIILASICDFWSIFQYLTSFVNFVATFVNRVRAGSFF
jgi:hypothetical protein